MLNNTVDCIADKVTLGITSYYDGKDGGGK
jgi:hypothetical protein